MRIGRRKMFFRGRTSLEHAKSSHPEGCAPNTTPCEMPHRFVMMWSSIHVVFGRARATSTTKMCKYPLRQLALSGPKVAPPTVRERTVFLYRAYRHHKKGGGREKGGHGRGVQPHLRGELREEQGFFHRAVSPAHDDHLPTHPRRRATAPHASFVKTRRRGDGGDVLGREPGEASVRVAAIRAGRPWSLVTAQPDTLRERWPG